MFVHTRKPSTLLSSHTNMHCGSTLIANECMFCYKVWPLVTKSTCCSADVNTVASQQHNQSGNKPCWVSVFPSRSLSLTHTHTLIEGNYRAVCRVSTHTQAHTVIEGNYRAVCQVKTSARGRIVLRDEWSDPDGHLETHWSQILHTDLLSWMVLGFWDTNNVKPHVLKKSNMV